MINRKEIEASKILENITLYYPDALADWKVSNPLSIEEHKEQSGSQIKSGIIFSVSGKKFEGKVIIYLVKDSKYTVELWHFKRRYVADMLEKRTGIYEWELATLLNSYIVGS
jgi:hypothetical protein